MGKHSVFFKGQASRSLTMFQCVYGQHNFFFGWVWGMEGGRVVLGGIGSECDGGALYEISKQIIKILGWGKEFYYTV